MAHGCPIYPLITGTALPFFLPCSHSILELCFFQTHMVIRTPPTFSRDDPPQSKTYCQVRANPLRSPGTKKKQSSPLHLNLPMMVSKFPNFQVNFAFKISSLHLSQLSLAFPISPLPILQILGWQLGDLIIRRHPAMELLPRSAFPRDLPAVPGRHGDGRDRGTAQGWRWHWWRTWGRLDDA